MCCRVHVGFFEGSRRQVSVTFVLCVTMQYWWFFVIGFIACVWTHHEQLFYKLVLQNHYFVSVPAFEHWKQVTGFRDHGILSPSWNVCRMCPREKLQLMRATALSWMWDFLMPQFWTSGGSMYDSAEWSFVATGPLGRLCRAAFCCSGATWKAVHSGLWLHQGHLEGCAKRPFVALGPLGGLCRAAFCCVRAAWKAVQNGLLLH